MAKFEKSMRYFVITVLWAVYCTVLWVVHWTEARTRAQCTHAIEIRSHDQSTLGGGEVRYYLIFLFGVEKRRQHAATIASFVGASLKTSKQITVPGEAKERENWVSETGPANKIARLIILLISIGINVKNWHIIQSSKLYSYNRHNCTHTICPYFGFSRPFLKRIKKSKLKDKLDSMSWLIKLARRIGGLSRHDL